MSDTNAQSIENVNEVTHNFGFRGVSGTDHSLAMFCVDNHYTVGVDGPFTLKQLLDMVPSIKCHDHIDILLNGKVIAEFVDGGIKD